MNQIIKFVKDNAGLVIGVALITIMLIAFGFASGWFSNVMGDLKDAQNRTSNTKYSYYDNAVVTGQDAINAITNYAGDKIGTTTFTVSVKTLAATSATVYNSASYSVTDPSNANYIDPVGSFTSSVTKNTNGIVTSITLTQK